ncbi:MAG: tRNA (adenosine(37)-N6)-threonylcarbamoyltransferase complex ATPase subunit type 1 TsaE [Erythrobacter sp.]
MSDTTRHELRDLDAMEEFGTRIADRLQAGDVIALRGGLGAGKTTLARAIITALGHRGDVPSPTFTIMETYDAPPLRLPIVHADFYRLEDPAELIELGLEDYRDGSALLAEWPDRAGNFDGEPACLSITIENAPAGPDAGRIAIAAPGEDWLGRWP